MCKQAPIIPKKHKQDENIIQDCEVESEAEINE